MKKLESYNILTLTHRQIKLNQIGDFVLKGVDTEDDLQQQLNSIKERFGLKELMYLSTCNRVMYAFSSDIELSDNFVVEFFHYINADLTDEQLQFVRDNVQLLTGGNAIMHLFEVASSIDSLVVGEREILRQLRESYDLCTRLATTGDDLRMAMRYTVEAAKDVYSSTRIGEKPISIVSLAIQQLLETKVSRSAKILIVGAGQTNNLVSKFLIKHQFTNFTVFNRSLERAEILAKKLKGNAGSLDNLPQYKGGFDVMIVCTGATKPIVTKALYEQLLNGDTDEKVVIDLSIPNNVAREATVFPMKYMEIETLRQLAKENHNFRVQEVGHARKILVDYLKLFASEYNSRQVVKALSDVPVQVKAVKERAMTQVFKDEVENLDDSTRALVERMMEYMEKKCIGIPMKVAREALK